MNKLTAQSKKLAYLLRHDKEYQFNEHGWREVSDLVANHGFTPELIDEIVATNNKRRFEYSADKTLIRARQGHSVNVDVELNETTPPHFLFHGTAESTVPQIMRDGIISGSRLHVHLSTDHDTAINVGKRHGKPIVLRINAKQMAEDGVKFFLSNNDVWLTEYVAVKYITLEQP
ncbi:MAG: RNA 2'-phosphotransferase [Muribaculaceae bacterium]